MIFQLMNSTRKNGY